MDTNTLFKLDMMKNSHGFILENPITPPVPRATAAQASLFASITALEAAAQKQTGGEVEAEGGVDLRALTARALRDYLKGINRTARAVEEDHPGIRPIFRLPRSGSYPALKATADNVVIKATELQTAFVEAGLPATFLTDLGALVTAFEEALETKQGGSRSRVEGTAALKIHARAGLKSATVLDACVRNHFRDQPALIAAWTHARHIERAPRRQSNTQSEPPPDGTGSGTGSTTPSGTLTA